MKTFPRFIAMALALAAFGLAGCGGSSGGDNGGSNNPPPDGGGNTGGITRTGVAIAVGPITGFGSVIVNGVTYQTDGTTTYAIDGSSGSQDLLEVGQMVLIQGTIDDDNTNAVATSVTFDDNVEGPVFGFDPVANRLNVMEQIVQLGPTTSIDDSCPETIDGFLAYGESAIEVSGPVRADGTIAATRIDCRDVADGFEVTGIVSNLDTTAGSFMINGLVVDYGAAMLDNFPGGTITEGDPVEAKGNSLGANEELLATSVEYKGARFAENEGDHIEIEGFITRFASAEDFDVSGLPVTTMAGTTVYEGGGATDLNLNLKVEVEGEFSAAGILVATKVDIKSSTAIRVTGRVDSVTGDSLQILGITVSTDTLRTRFEDKLNDVDPFRIGDVNVDDYVEIRGQETPPGQIFALLLERDDPRPETELRGFVEAGGVTRPTLSVLGVTIETNEFTVLRDAGGNTTDPETFWAAVGEGSLVDAKGIESGSTTLVAEEIQLELE